MTTNKNKPEITLRDGSLKAAIWKNPSQNGPFYSVQLTRTFKTEAGFQDTTSLKAGDLLRASELLTQTYRQVRAFEKADRDMARAEALAEQGQNQVVA